MASNLETKPQIARKIGLVTATAIVIANMIGTGIFTTTGLLANHLPNGTWILACWVLGGLIALSGALSYAELATRMPQEGGEYIYLKKLYHPLVGFLTGWTSFFVGFSAPIAAAAISFSLYIFAGLNIEPSQSFIPFLSVIDLLAISIVVIFTLIHYLGLHIGSSVQNALTVIKVLIVLGLAGFGIIVGGGDFVHSLKQQISTSDLGFGAAMMLIMFSYSGWNASSYIAGELKNPRKTLPISLVVGTIIVIFLYLITNIFILKEIPYTELQNTIAVVEVAAVNTFGSWIGNIMGLLISLALLSSLSAFILIGPRVYYAMALDKLFFPFASRVHPKYHVPGSSIIIQGLLAVLMILIGSFEQLLIYMGFALSIFPWLAVAGLFIARRKHVGDDIAVKVKGYPLIPLFFLLSSLSLMIITVINKPFEAFAATLTILVGIPLYLIWIKKFNLETNNISS